MRDLSFPEEMKGVFRPLKVTAISPLHIKTPAFGKHVSVLLDPSCGTGFKSDSTVPPLRGPRLPTRSQLLNVSCEGPDGRETAVLSPQDDVQPKVRTV